MSKLSTNFHINKYGLDVRLVNEGDASFIYDLRSNSQLNKFINQVSDGVENQVVWLKRYKERELLGEDYYFIYYYNNEPIGLNRVYDIKENEFTGGSFVFKPQCPFELPIYAAIIQFEVGFELLNKKIANGDIRRGNKKVIKFHKILNVSFTYEDEENIYYKYPREEFMLQKCKILNMLK